jgi:hypothetical protein
LRTSSIARLTDIVPKFFEAAPLCLVPLALQPRLSGSLSSGLPFGNLRMDRRHFFVELPVSKDMGIGESGIVIVERLGKLILRQPFTVIFGEILYVEPFGGTIALATAAADPPFAAIFEIDGAKIPASSSRTVCEALSA